MTKNPIQEERMKRYFIDAAIELIKAEGVTVVSARNVAERSGYSYATIYNYFKDIRDLVFTCIEDFQQELGEFMNQETRKAKKGSERILSSAKAYIKYFTMYPGVFELFFLEKSGKISTKNSNIESLVKFFLEFTNPDWSEFEIEFESKTSNKLGEKELEIIKNTINLSIPGELMFFINRRHSDSYKNVEERVLEIIKRVLEK